MGRLRGKRNRKSDRYFNEKRQSEQHGMVSADVALCCFCAALLASDQVAPTQSSESVCYRCATERGIFITPQSDGRTALIAAEALTFGSRGSKRASIDGFTIIRKGVTPQVHPSVILLRALDDRLSTIGSRLFSKARYLVIPRKLTHAQVEEIRRRYSKGTESFKRLGAEFGISGASISQIVWGDTYRHVGGPVLRHDAARVHKWIGGTFGDVERAWVTHLLART